MGFLLIAGALSAGIFLLSGYYCRERQAGRVVSWLIRGEGEGRWGSVLILMGSSLVFVLGKEAGWFGHATPGASLTGLGLLAAVALLAEWLAWIIGKGRD